MSELEIKLWPHHLILVKNYLERNGITWDLRSPREDEYGLEVKNNFFDLINLVVSQPDTIVFVVSLDINENWICDPRCKMRERIASDEIYRRKRHLLNCDSQVAVDLELANLEKMNMYNGQRIRVRDYIDFTRVK